MNNELVKKLDEVFSTYVRLRDSDCSGYVRCYCCGYPVHWKLAQNGHFMNRRHLGTRFDERNCHSCCAVCNMGLNGNLDAYEAHLKRDYGETIIDKLTMLKNTVTKFTDHELKDMIEHYQGEVKRLRKEKGL